MEGGGWVFFSEGHVALGTCFISSLALNVLLRLAAVFFGLRAH